MGLKEKSRKSKLGGKPTSIDAFGGLFRPRTQPVLAVALSLILAAFVFSIAVPYAEAADPGHAASSISSGQFESGDYTFPSNLTVTKFFIANGTTLYVDAINGRVGIGTTSPENLLDVRNTGGDANLSIVAANNNIAYLKLMEGADLEPLNDYGGMLKYDGTGNVFQIGTITNSVEYPVMYIQRLSYSVGIGIIDPSSTLHVNSSSGNGSFQVQNTTGASHLFVNGTTGGVGIGTASPSPNGLLHVSGSNLNIYADSYGGQAGWVSRRADGTASAPTAVQENELIASFNGRPYGTTGFASGRRGAFNIYAAENATDSEQGTYLTLETTAIGGTSLSEKVRVNPDGSVGIGTTSPENLLDIRNAGGNANMSIAAADNNISYLKLMEGANNEPVNDYGGMLKYDGSANNFQIGTINNSVEYPVIYIQRGSSNVGIGTTTPNYLLETKVTEKAANLSSILYVNGTSGNVGIGTASPSFNVHLVGTVDPVAVTVDAVGNAAPQFMGRRAQGSIGSETAVQTNDALFILQGRGYGATGYSSGSRASMRFYASGEWNDTAQGTYILFTTTANATTTSVTAMKIDPSGNVGIGTTSPTTKLDVNGSLNITDANGRVRTPELCLTTDSCRTTWPTGGNSTEEMQDAVGGGIDVTLNYTDASNLMGVNRTWMSANYLSSESDPRWSGNYTACTSSQKLYFSGTTLACNADADTTCSSAACTVGSDDTLSNPSVSANLNMSNNLIENIGNAGTDFTSGGGLNLAGNLGITGTVSNTISGNSTFDGGTLFVDSNNDRVGIGNTGPDTALHVQGGVCVDTDAVCTDPGSGNITVTNTLSTAAAKTTNLYDSDNSAFLDLSGCGDNTYVSSVDATGLITCTAESGGGGGWATSGGYVYNSTATGVGIGTTSPGYKLEINSADKALNVSNLLFVNSTYVGIGTSNPTSPLAIYSASQYYVTIRDGTSNGLKLGSNGVLTSSRSDGDIYFGFYSDYYGAQNTSYFWYDGGTTTISEIASLSSTGNMQIDGDFNVSGGDIQISSNGGCANTAALCRSGGDTMIRSSGGGDVIVRLG